MAEEKKTPQEELDQEDQIQEEEELILNKDDIKKMKGGAGSGSVWKNKIAAYLKEHQGVDEITLYDATRPDRLEIPESKKIKNLASQYTYMKDEGMVVIKEEGKIFLVTEPVPGKKNAFRVVDGQRERAKQLLGK